MANQCPHGNETILVVDDEEYIRNLNSAILQRLGYQVMEASSGDEGLKIFSEQPGKIDLVILDVSMPGLSGKEVLDQLYMIDPQVKVIISSGYSKEGLPDGIDRMGASGYLTKPYRLAEMAQTLREVLDRS